MTIPKLVLSGSFEVAGGCYFEVEKASDYCKTSAKIKGVKTPIIVNVSSSDDALIMANFKKSTVKKNAERTCAQAARFEISKRL